MRIAGIGFKWFQFCALHFNNRQSLRILSPDFDGIFNKQIIDLLLWTITQQLTLCTSFFYNSIYSRTYTDSLYISLRLSIYTLIHFGTALSLILCSLITEAELHRQNFEN